MVQEQVVKDTIRRMKDSGIDESVIIETLQDIGLTEEEAQDFIERTAQDLARADAEKVTPEKIAEQTAERVREHINDARQEEGFKQEMTHNAIEEQREKIESVGRRLDELHEKIPEKIDFEKSEKTTGSSMKDLKTEIQDLKAMTKANKKLMEDILDVNRKILTKLD